MLIKLIEQAQRRKDAALLLKLAKYSFDQWLYYSNLVPVIFNFKYADNAINKARGRVNRNSGFRQGVRNLAFVPVDKHPKNFNPDTKTYRYFDMGRGNYRSFRPGNFMNVTAFWSEEKKQFVDTPEEAGILPGQPFIPSTKSTEKSDGTREKRAADREAKKQERERERAWVKRNEAERRARKKLESRIKKALK